jgi:hypothetical protein
MVEQASSLFTSTQARRLCHEMKDRREARRFPPHISDIPSKL